MAKKHKILGDFRFFPHKQNNWQPLNMFLKDFCCFFFGDTRDKMEHIDEKICLLPIIFQTFYLALTRYTVEILNCLDYILLKII